MPKAIKRINTPQMNRELLLEKYFENSLSAAEQIEFEHLLAADEDFAKAFAFERDVKKAFTLNERAKLKQKLKSFDEVKTVKISSSKWYYAAACLITIAGFSVWFSLKQPTNEELFQTYYQTYPNVIAPTVRGTQLEDIKTKAFEAYDNGEYQLAAKLFEEIYTKDQGDFALLYQSLSLMELKEYDAAKQQFKKFDYTKNNQFSNYFKWYLALAELQTNDKESAINLLKELSLVANPMQEMAKKLLTDLN